MDLSRTDRVIIYTCSVVLVSLVGYAFYRVLVLAIRDRLAGRREEGAGCGREAETPDERRIRRLLQRPDIRQVLASRAAETLKNAQSLPSRSASSDSVRDNLSLSGNLDPSGSSSLPPAYDTLSLASSSPPPSYRSDAASDPSMQ